MSIKKILLAAGLVFLLAFALGVGGFFPTPRAEGAVLGGVSQAPAAQETPPVPAETDEAVREAFQAAVDQKRSLLLGLNIFEVLVDNIQYSQDGKTALLWLTMRDRETGQMIETEPGLSIAYNTNNLLPGASASWSVLLQAESDNFAEQLSQLPPELLTEDIRQRFLEGEGAAAMEAAAAQVYSGYKLPWTAGLSKRVTNSIGHVYPVAGGLTSCASSCRYAFDFADGTMFPLLAAKGGKVRAAKWTCPNFGTDCTNYLVLEDESTVPTTYQLYYHMAQNSVPTRLRTVGAVVQQGEYIGNTDDTGYSTGHHLHFHVYVSPTSSNWSWGNSVDITFDDVKDNGGRPRTCAEAREYPGMGSACQTSNLYTSGNTPANPPTGTLDSPANRTTLNARTLRVSGTARDDIEVTRIQVVANFDGTWKAIDDIAPTAGTRNFAKDVDLCAANIPDGPVSLTVRIFDREGSMAENIPVRQVIKNYACGGTVEAPPPPACTPAADQVALYADPDFRGACQVFDINNSQGYTSSSFGALGNDNAASIQVGSGAAAILYDRGEDVSLARPQGRIQNFFSSDAGFSDNPLLPDTVSGIRVVSRSVQPGEVVLNPIGNRRASSTPTSVNSLVLSWNGGAGAQSFDVRLTGPGTNLSTNVTGYSFSVGNLAAGAYTLSVTAKNGSRASTGQANFTVAAASLPTATAKAVPFSDNMEAGAGSWVKTGLWRLGSINEGNRAASNAWIYNSGATYADTTFRAGDITSPPITIPANGVQYLRFLYYMDTEDSNPYWDQRLVQVSANGGPFENLVQLSGDKQAIGQVWLSSGPISLQRYAGATIRLRFHFDAVDMLNNEGRGWAIDDVSINATAPISTCGDNNNSPSNAQAVKPGDIISAVICPEGDIDYYRIDAQSGMPVSVDINARTLSPASKLDSLVSILDEDGSSVLAENDDEVYATLQDSLLSYVFSRSGTYYIRVRAWDYPGSGSTAYFYNMDLTQKTAVLPRSVKILYPAKNLAPQVPFTIEAGAVDYDGGEVQAMDFYWHGPDWSAGWVKLGTDTSGVDGWTFPVNPALYGDVTGSAVYVQAVSWTGGVRGVAAWDLAPDRSVPTSRMSTLPGTVDSTAVKLSWDASDSQNDIDHFDVDYQVSTGGSFSAWQRWTRTLPGYFRTVWFDGQPGASYRFRMRAVDAAGNAEAMPSSAEAETRLASSCAPDAREGGQTSEQTVALTRGRLEAFNLCKSAQDGTDDVDWVSVRAQAAGEDILLQFLPQGSGAYLTVAMYSSSSQLLGTWRAYNFSEPIAVRWKAPASGTYYLEIKPVKPTLFGSSMTYKVWYGKGTWIYVPEAHR